MGALSGRRGVKCSGSRRRWSLAAVMASLLILGCGIGASAAEAIVTEGRVLTEREQAWVQDNPALADVAATAPQLLPEILDKLTLTLANPSTGRGGLVPLDEEAAKLLHANPALMEAWRSSPEASADLLELIRIAAGKPRK